LPRQWSGKTVSSAGLGRVIMRCEQLEEFAKQLSNSARRDRHDRSVGLRASALSRRPRPRCCAARHRRHSRPLFVVAPPLADSAYAGDKLLNTLTNSATGRSKWGRAWPMSSVLSSCRAPGSSNAPLPGLIAKAWLYLASVQLLGPRQWLMLPMRF
jgi:hypothetical protein